MAQYNPFKFQQDAIEELVDVFKKLWNNDLQTSEITFKSPTGSGKTFMVTHFVDALNNQPDWDEDVAFVWITFSDDLAMQSKEKFTEYFFPNISNQLLTIQDLANGILKKRDILFLNWQKLVASKASARVLRRPNEEEKHKEQGFYFEDVVENTHAEGRQIVMIIDESHKNVTEAAIRDVITPLNPRIILKVSATPESEPTASDIKHNKAGFVEVERKDVVEAGLIKREILSQTEDDLNVYCNQDHDKLLLDLAIAKRDAIAAEWKSIGENINPLVLIQLPNDDKKTKDTDVKTKEEIVTEYLTKEKNISPNKIAYWFDGRRENMDNITDNDSKVEFMLFKYAAGTGWDCPRAHVLVMYREIKSNTFHTQTLGRILRMAVHGKDLTCHPMLTTGYLFTNYQRNEVQNPEDNKSDNKPKTVISGVKTDQKVKMATSEAAQQLIEKVTKQLENVPDAQDKIATFVKNVVPKIAQSAKVASEITSHTNDVLEINNKRIQHQQETSKEINKQAREILGEDICNSLNYDINSLISNVIDTVVDNHRDAEFILDPCLLTDFISRTDYGDFGKATTFQSHFVESMNEYFGITHTQTEIEKELKFKDKDVSTSAIHERDVVVNARFVSTDENAENDLGKNIKQEVSDNDVEKEFSWRCYEILGNNTDDETKIGNVARTWGTLKEALRQWFSQALPNKPQITYYKIFLKDVQKGDSSVFRSGIRKALVDYRPILEDFLKKKKASEEAQKSVPFVLKSRYAFTDDYKPFNPSTLSYVQPFLLPDQYSGRNNEVEFIKYLETKYNIVEWWFKNGTGKEAYGLKYTDSQSNKERIFYPDWLIKFIDGRIGIFDTKGGFTANDSEVKDKAEALYLRIEELNKLSKIKYVGGIVICKGGVWYFTNTSSYKSYEKDSSAWKSMDDEMK